MRKVALTRLAICDWNFSKVDVKNTQSANGKTQEKIGPPLCTLPCVYRVGPDLSYICYMIN